MILFRDITARKKAEEALKQANENLEVKCLIENKKIEVHVDQTPAINADRTQMLQLMQNLNNYAVKFSNADSPKIHISVSMDSHEWVFSVADNGICLNMEHTDKIFQML